jgi:chromosome segregation ATPase
MSDSAEMNRAFQQIGELVGSLRALHDKIDLQHAVAEKQNDRLQAELRNVKHDLRDLEQKHDAAVHILTEDVSAIRKLQDDVKGSVDELRKPVEEIMTLRAKALGALLVLGPIGAATLYFVPDALHALWRIIGFLVRTGGM